MCAEPPVNLRQRPRCAIVLAGGLGMRLRSVIGDLPKPLAPVGNRPFLAYLLDELLENGFSSVVLAVSWRREAIIDSFGASYAGLELRYSIEDEPLGTGGAIRQAFAHIDDDIAFVLNGDTFQRLPYDSMLRLGSGEAADAVVAVRRVSDASRYGVVDLEGDRIRKFASSGSRAHGLINAGAYLLRRKLVEDDRLPKAFSFESELAASFIDENVVLAYPVDGDFIDIGVPADYARAQVEAPRWRERARQ